MGAAANPPPLVCFKWPWSPNPPHPPGNPNPSPCGALELPWLFKSVRTLAQGLLIAGDLPAPAGGFRGRGRRTGPVAVEADRGDAEQRAFAAALASGRPATVLEFYSPRCRLCASLQGLVREMEDGAGGSAAFVHADAEDDRWLPEIYKAAASSCCRSEASPFCLMLFRIYLIDDSAFSLESKAGSRAN